MLRNDPRMYSQGTVLLDSQPIVNLYGQLMAKKQAKQDALDEYDKQRINNINGTGVRDQDREGLDQRVKQIQEFYQGNKDKIRKGGTPESYAYEKMFRDVSGYVNQSKERTARGDAAMKLYNERLKQDGRIPDDFINELHENELGIDKLTGVDPQTGQPRKSQPLNLSKWLSQPKPFNQQTYLKSFGDIKRTPQPPVYTPVEGNPLKLTETINETFDKDAAQVIHARAADKYQNSFSFAEQVKAEVADPVRRKQLADTFKQTFGTDPAIPEDYATAFTLELLQPNIPKVKAVDNKDAIMNKAADIALNRQKTMESIRQGNRIDIALLRRGWQVADQQAQDEYLDAIVEGYKKNGKVDPKVVDDYEKSDGKGHKVPIDKQVFNSDGTVDMIVYKLDKKGNYTTEVDETYSTRGVPISQIKAKTRKVIETQMTNTNTQRKPTGNTKQPTKKEIKRSDISTKAAAAGYSVKEYEALLIKNGVTIKD